MFKINDYVKVKPGIMDPDNETTEIGGWQGCITEIDDSDPNEILITIAWDSQTLRTMPGEFVEESIREGLDFSEMTLLADEVELTATRDKARDRDEVIRALEQENSWADLGEQGKRIQAVESACEHDFALMDHWFEYLENNVELPVKAKYVGDSSQNLRHGAEILINGFAETDDDYGVIGSAIYQKRWIQVLLCDVQVLESSKKSEALEDYIVWFANR